MRGTVLNLAALLGCSAAIAYCTTILMSVGEGDLRLMQRLEDGRLLADAAPGAVYAFDAAGGGFQRTPVCLPDPASLALNASEISYRVENRLGGQMSSVVDFFAAGVAGLGVGAFEPRSTLIEYRLVELLSESRPILRADCQEAVRAHLAEGSLMLVVDTVFYRSDAGAARDRAVFVSFRPKPLTFANCLPEALTRGECTEPKPLSVDPRVHWDSRLRVFLGVVEIV